MELYFDQSYFEGAKRTEPVAEMEEDMVVGSVEVCWNISSEYDHQYLENKIEVLSPRDTIRRRIKLFGPAMYGGEVHTQ